MWMQARRFCSSSRAVLRVLERLVESADSGSRHLRPSASLSRRCRDGCIAQQVKRTSCASGPWDRATASATTHGAFAPASTSTASPSSNGSRSLRVYLLQPSRAGTGRRSAWKAECERGGTAARCSGVGSDQLVVEPFLNFGTHALARVQLEGLVE